MQDRQEAVEIAAVVATVVEGTAVAVLTAWATLPRRRPRIWQRLLSWLP